MEPHENRPDEAAPEQPGQPQPELTPAVVEPKPAEPVKATPAPAADPEDEEEEHMLRMSFLEHLEELRTRILRALYGIGISFVLCLVYAQELWAFVRQPIVKVLTDLKLDPNLVQIKPMEAFSIVYVKVPIVAAIFLAAPWVLYQVWAFIAPGLYRKERRMATPFILSTASLFLLGGVFGYFVVFRFGLTFLLGIGPDSGIKPMITATEYTDLFINVMLGIGAVFELPVLIFFLTLLRVASPRWLLANSRYAILGITILAALITPTPDVVNLTIFAAPMILLYFLGLFASYLLVLRREGEKFPWRILLYWVAGVGVFAALIVYVMVARYGFRLSPVWPFLVR